MYFREDDFEVADAVEQIAKQRGVSPTQIACAWILQAPGVTAPIIGATKPHHLKELIAAVDIKLSPEEVAAIEKPYRPHPILGHEQPNPSRMVARTDLGVGREVKALLEVAEALGNLRAPFYFAGGWAIDLHLGRVTREHHDVDALVMRRDHLLLHKALKQFSLKKIIPRPMESRRIGGRLSSGQPASVSSCRCIRLMPIARANRSWRSK